jgi:hypothetical protein
MFRMGTKKIGTFVEYAANPVSVYSITRRTHLMGGMDMKHHKVVMRPVGYWLSAAVFLALAGPSAEAGFLTKSLQICDQGSFFVGGVPKTTRFANGYTTGNPPVPITASTPYAQITVGQMYVQFQVPEAARKWPLIIVHGSTHSGACVESTPQGTEGWAPYSVRNKLATYVVDQPGRGRSGNDNSRIMEGVAALTGNPLADPTTTIPNIGRITDNGSYTSWFGHLVQPGTATPCTDITTCELRPHGWRADDPSTPDIHPNPAGYLPAYALPPKGVSDFVQPANLNYTGVGAGFTGPTTARVPSTADAFKLHYYRQLLPNYEVTLPGSTCPACVPTAQSAANTWSPRDLASLVERLGGAIVAVHSQSGLQGYNMTRVLKEDGKLNMLKGFIDVEGMCPSLAQVGLTAPDFDNVPLLVVKGDYRPDNDPSLPCYNEVHARRLAGFGTAAATYIALDDPSYKGQFNGVTHMMMDGTNALEVMDVILDWANKNIPNPPSTGKCNSPPPPAS